MSDRHCVSSWQWVQALALSVLASRAAAQAEPADSPARAIREERVTEIVRFLASDELGGRDTPSPGLERAAEYLAEQLAKAGLRPAAADGSFFHRYRANGATLDSTKLEVRVVGPDGAEVTLAPEADVRLWQASAAMTQELGEVLRIDGSGGDSGLSRRLRGRRPVLIEVDAKGPWWNAAAGNRRVLARGNAGAPWLLVRKGLLPAGELRAEISVPAPEPTELELTNVVAALPGADGATELVLFSAHYDHIGIRPAQGDDVICNGADDDASGTTAVLALAEAFARARALRRGLAFAFFSGEEKGLIGSRAFAREPPWPLESIAANVNVEMLGRPPEGARHQAWVTGRDLSDFEAIAAPALGRAGIECIAFPMQSALFAASDNWALAERGVVAHSISAGTLHRDYHQPGDEADKLDVPHMTAVIRGLYEVGVELATRPDRPSYNDRGRQRIGAK
jgi:hypothetical protein